MRRVCCTETSVTTNIRCVTSQKGEYVIYTAAEVSNNEICVFVCPSSQAALDTKIEFLESFSTSSHAACLGVSKFLNYSTTFTGPLFTSDMLTAILGEWHALIFILLSSRISHQSVVSSCVNFLLWPSIFVWLLYSCLFTLLTLFSCRSFSKILLPFDG